MSSNMLKPTRTKNKNENFSKLSKNTQVVQSIHYPELVLYTCFLLKKEQYNNLIPEMIWEKKGYEH